MLTKRTSVTNINTYEENDMRDKFTIKINTIKRIKDFVEDMNSFVSDVDAIRGRYILDAKSILGLMSVDLLLPLDIRINTSDEDELIRFNKVIQRYLN